LSVESGEEHVSSLPASSSLPPITRLELLHLYERMYAIRRVEEMAARAYTQRKILGFCHLYIGQESVAVGAAAACKPEDHWITGYREHGQAMAKGTSARAVMAELYGKATGSSRGLGGSMHIFDASVNFMGGYGIVGAHVPLAVGVAWGLKAKSTGGVAVCFFGDGAAHQGAFFEALCLAQLYTLPVVFLCENNYYAMGTSIERQSYLLDMSLRGRGVGMVREQFQAFDVELVRDRVGAAVEFARSGKGPVILEAVTYRFRGHSMSDPAKYRKEGELEAKKQTDPLLITEKRLREDFAATDPELEAIRQKVEAEAEDAVRFAEESPIPNPADLYNYTYAPSTK
jgi:pyruvate dehydrogenase E1 component alpha subunit